jgi:hypothetical protein
MSKQTPEQRIANLERMVQDLAKDYAEQVYGHDGPFEWDDEQGWLLIVRSGKVTIKDA